ncbi:hypothetical protein EW146_g5289 [Bondarzewia mesenterica]|uniref:Uncharacterized protein n=1 Tax=Bondarzewia mesenterica TaxID=1095465 RepID=A0A4V3XEV7_9AGAM|nr:hypothetical protein EW146_g5289 [Bondarzewia mesenterica]
MANNYDSEKGQVASAITVDDVEFAESALVSRYGRLGPVLAKIFNSGVEARGVERVPEDQREDKHAWNNLLMWWSVNTVLTTIPIGVLAQEFYTLTMPHAIATIMCFGALGGVATAFIATLGPQTGLRTMIITRFSSGYVGGIIYSILNILTQLGFSTTAVILAGQTLASINPGTLPLVVGIIIIVLFIVMLFLWGLGGKAGFDINAQKALEDKGRSLSSDILSFGGIVFGSFTGWAPVAADYNCRLPANTSSSKIFVLTFFGLFIPICFAEILGAALMTITDPAYTDAFASGSTGGLLGQILSPWKGGGKFILVLLALSVVANNIPNTYSAGLSIQALGRPFALVPRFFWTFICFVIYTVAGVAGREHFSEILSNFLSILSYWTAFFVVIVAEEHFVFRRGKAGYNLDDWDSPGRLPLGVAGILAGCFGVAGAVVGMAEVWYIGPLGKMAGTLYGADLGFETDLFCTLNTTRQNSNKLCPDFTAILHTRWCSRLQELPSGFCPNTGTDVLSSVAWPAGSTEMQEIPRQDVDLLIFPAYASAGQEALKALLVGADSRFYLRDARSPFATYKVLWYRESTFGYSYASCKVDILLPGIMNLPSLPDRYDKVIQGFSVVPFSLLLVTKLQAWDDHRNENSWWKREKQHTDVQDLRVLLQLPESRRLNRETWRDEILFSPHLQTLTARRVREFCAMFRETAQRWKAIGFETGV